MRVLYKGRRRARIEQVYVGLFAVHGAVPALFHAEHKHFPIQRFRAPRLYRSAHAIGDVVKLFVVVDRDDGLYFLALDLGHGDVLIHDGIYLFHRQAFGREIGIVLYHPAARVAAGPVVLVVNP